MKNPQKVFSKAYEKHADAIYRHCYFRVSDRETAENLMQETFMKTWEYMRGNETPKNIRAFLYRVATNLIIDHYRKKKESSLDALSENGLQVSDDSHKDIEKTADIKALLHKLDELEPEDKDLILMRFVDDMRPKEIASLLDLTTNVVSVRIHRAVQKLKKAYEAKQRI